MDYPYYVLGRFEKSEEKAEVVSPHTLHTIGSVYLISSSRLKEVLDELLTVKSVWKESKIKERVKLLHTWKKEIEKRKEEFIDILIKESGKSIHYAEGEVNALLKRFDFIEREIEKLQPKFIDGDIGQGNDGRYALVIREPYGGAVCIAPFNYPLLTLMIKVIPAILGGNVVVAKPSLKTPISSILLAEAFDKAASKIGIDKRIFNVVIGHSSEIGDVLITHSFADIISFTGSTKVGEKIASKIKLKKFHAELGGKGTALVLDDKNMEHYAREICLGAFKFSGQRCDAISRVIVLENIKGALLNALKEEVKKWKFGDPYSQTTNLVPLIDEKAADKVETLIKDAIQKGAELIYGYKREKNKITPAILDNVDQTMDIFYEEVFGPVITITTAKDIKEAIELAKDNYYGLDASIFFTDLNKAIEIAKKMEEGEITINAHPAHGVGYFPFGGNKKSGIGREGVYYSLLEFTRIKTIVVRK